MESRRYASLLTFVLLSGLTLAATAGVSFAGSEPAAETAARPEQQRLPAFDGRTLDGKSMSTKSFSGKRLLLLFFNPGIEQSASYARALQALAPERARNNFEIAAVALGLDSAKARAFAKDLGLGFPIFDDSDGHISAGLGLQSPVMLIGSDADGRVGFAMMAFAHDPATPSAAIEAGARTYLRLPATGAAAGGSLDQRPMAPQFEAERVGKGDRFRLADMAGKPVVLAFFLSTCPHCQQALRFFKDELARIPEKSRPAFIGIATDSSVYAAPANLEEKKLDFFPVFEDPDRSIAAAYGSFSGVPDIVLIDSGGRITFRTNGWDGQRDPNLMKMYLAKIAGIDVPMLLDHDGYSGNDACTVCHQKEAQAWRFTDHSVAFDSLVTRNADHDPKCVGCHVVGYGKQGGYSEAAAETALENVGCESCHGRGGGHLEKKSSGAVASAVCEGCHDPQHSLGFDYAKFLPKVSHAAITALADGERAKLVAGRDQPHDLLPATSAFVGSTACQGCHLREYGIWSGSAHARSVESIRKDKKDLDPKCVRCHVTGYARSGGFAEGTRPKSGEDLSRVGCESCHGPGAEHVKSGGKQAAGIVGLGDKCDSCVILQICGSCHDDANDPGFRFEVGRKIELQHHGPPRPVPASAH